MKKVIAIVGPTGIGKTKLSIALAKYLNTEIISGDSVQVYKELNIGSAKVKEEEKEGVNHHLIDILSLGEEYTVYDFQKEVRRLIDELSDKNKLPIICGGTGFYIKAALYDYEFKEETIKKRSLYEDFSNEELYKMLEKLNPIALKTVHINNRQRLIRAIEKAENNEIESTKKNVPLYDILILGLTEERENLYEIINKRVDKMINEGLKEEAFNLFNQGKYPKAIGYNEMLDYYNLNLSFEEAINEIKKNSRHYAKRQYTWFNNQMNVTWLYVNLDNFESTIDLAIKKVDEFCKKNTND